MIKRVLIVEDDSIISMFLEEVLLDLGYAVDVIHDGKKAIELTQKELPNVVLMDIGLKGELDGLDTAIQILKLGNIPIAVISGNTDIMENDPRMDKVNPFRRIKKPIAEYDIEQLMSSYEALRPSAKPSHQ